MPISPKIGVYVQGSTSEIWNLQPRDCMVEFYVRTNKKDLENDIRLQGCPSNLLDKVKGVVTDYWGVLCEYVFCWPIQEFSFQIGTCDHPPCCNYQSQGNPKTG